MCPAGRRNPFNGIERLELLHPEHGVKTVRNPFNGIERFYGEGYLALAGLAMNPFNGIERDLVP